MPGWTIDVTSVSVGVVGNLMFVGKAIAPNGEDGDIGGPIVAGLGSKKAAIATSSSLSRVSEPFQNTGLRVEAGVFRNAAAVVAVVAFVVLVCS